MSDVPFDVLMRGPAAVAAWLMHEDERERQRFDLMRTHIQNCLRTLNLDSRQPGATVTSDNLAMALGAVVQLSAILSYVSNAGMRAAARDQVAAVLDGCFDLIDEAEGESSEFAEIVRALRGLK